LARDAVNLAEEKEQERRVKDNEILKLTKALSFQEAMFSKTVEPEHKQEQNDTAVQRGSDVRVIVNNTFSTGKTRRQN